MIRVCESRLLSVLPHRTYAYIPHELLLLYRELQLHSSTDNSNLASHTCNSARNIVYSPIIVFFLGLKSARDLRIANQIAAARTYHEKNQLLYYTWYRYSKREQVSALAPTFYDCGTTDIK